MQLRKRVDHHLLRNAAAPGVGEHAHTRDSPERHAPPVPHLPHRVDCVAPDHPLAFVVGDPELLVAQPLAEALPAGDRGVEGLAERFHEGKPLGLAQWADGDGHAGA